MTTASPSPMKTTASAMPLGFILLWSSGYVGGAVGILYAEPFTMTFLRFLLAGLIVLGFALATGARMPSKWQQIGHIGRCGISYAGDAVWRPLCRHEAWRSRGTIGVDCWPHADFRRSGRGAGLEGKNRLDPVGRPFFGLCGVVLVVGQRLGSDLSALAGYAFTAIALFGITAGTLYQKRFCSALDLRIAGCVQMLVGSIVMLLAALLTERMRINWSSAFIGSVIWLAIVKSIGALMLLYAMIRRGEASKVASLFYLIPPVTQVMASLILGEMPLAMALVGFALSAIGVFLSNRREPAHRPLARHETIGNANP